MDHRSPSPPSTLDARMRRSRAALFDALPALLGEPPIDRITIREITRAAGVGYATFFRHYPNHDVNRMLVRAMPERLGHRVDLAADGAEAVAMATAAAAAGDAPYAIALMDGQMPNVDGIEATRRLRAAGLEPGTLPILALTANAYADDIAACLNAEMQAHLAKPPNGQGLDAAIRRWTAPAPAAADPARAERFSPQLRERYAARREELIAAIETLAAARRVSDAEIVELSRMLHKFLGSAAMFGDAELAREARALEEGFPLWSRARRSEELRRAAGAMRRAA